MSQNWTFWPGTIGISRAQTLSRWQPRSDILAKSNILTAAISVIGNSVPLESHGLKLITINDDCWLCIWHLCHFVGISRSQTLSGPQPRKGLWLRNLTGGSGSQTSYWPLGIGSRWTAQIEILNFYLTILFFNNWNLTGSNSNSGPGISRGGPVAKTHNCNWDFDFVFDNFVHQQLVQEPLGVGSRVTVQIEILTLYLTFVHFVGISRAQTHHHRP